MNQSGCAFEGLHQVRPQGIAQQREHGVRARELLRRHRLAVVGETDQDAIEPRAQIGLVLGQAEHGHHLGGGRDIETRFPRHALLAPAEAHDHAAQRAIVHVHHATPQDPARIDLQLVSEVEMIVEQRRQQVVSGRDGVKVAREVEVDTIHGQELTSPTAGSTAFHAQRRPE